MKILRILIVLGMFLVGASSAMADPADTDIAAVGAVDSPIILDIYEDYLCPYSAAFEREFGDQITRATASGNLHVRYHLLHFLDPQSASGDYSTRAAGAALALFRHRPDLFEEFHSKLFAEDTQPEEGGSLDLTNDQLADIAAAVGADFFTVIQIRHGASRAEADELAEKSTEELRGRAGKVSVPAVIQGGHTVSTEDTNWLNTLVKPASSEKLSTH